MTAEQQPAPSSQPVFLNNGYMLRKGLKRGQNEKTERERFLTIEEVNQVLKTIRAADHVNRQRDHCMLFMGFYFGLRVGEVAILERDNFRLLSRGKVFIRRLKSVPRIPIRCKHCQYRATTSAKRIGQMWKCSNCFKEFKVPEPEKPVDMRPPEKSPPVVETPVLKYIETYMNTHMRPDQRWFFESKKSKWDEPHTIQHISTRQIQIVFSTWMHHAGFPAMYSWHALRHARGSFLYERFEDLKVVKDMLGHKSLASTEKYLHMSPSRQSKLTDALNLIFGSL